MTTNEKTHTLDLTPAQPTVPAPAAKVEILLTEKDIEDGKAFSQKYLCDENPYVEGMSWEHRDLIATVFVASAHKLPVFSIDIPEWFDETPVYDGENAMRGYLAEKDAKRAAQAA